MGASDTSTSEAHLALPTQVRALSLCLRLCLCLSVSVCVAVAAAVPVPPPPLSQHIWLYADFARQFFPVFDKEALIIDVRHNSGGNQGVSLSL